MENKGDKLRRFMIMDANTLSNYANNYYDLGGDKEISFCLEWDENDPQDVECQARFRALQLITWSNSKVIIYGGKGTDSFAFPYPRSNFLEVIEDAFEAYVSTVLVDTMDDETEKKGE